MQIVALPLTTAEMAQAQVLTLPHFLLVGGRDLEPGQLVIAQDDDGAYWGATVVQLRFTEDSTHYVFAIDSPVAPEWVAALGLVGPTTKWTAGEVALHLRAAAAQQRLLPAG